MALSGGLPGGGGGGCADSVRGIAFGNGGRRPMGWNGTCWSLCFLVNVSLSSVCPCLGLFCAGVAGGVVIVGDGAGVAGCVVGDGAGVAGNVVGDGAGVEAIGGGGGGGVVALSGGLPAGGAGGCADAVRGIAFGRGGSS